MLYERLTGTPPFRVRDDVELPEFEYYHQVIEHVPPAPSILNPAVPEGLSALTMRLLAKTPESGYSGAAPVREELEAALAAAPASWDAPFVPPRRPARNDFSRATLARSPRASETGRRRGASRRRGRRHGFTAPGNTQAAIDVLVGRRSSSAGRRVRHPCADARCSLVSPPRGRRAPREPAPAGEGTGLRARPLSGGWASSSGESRGAVGAPAHSPSPFWERWSSWEARWPRGSFLQGRRATPKTLLERYREDLAREQAAPREAERHDSRGSFAVDACTGSSRSSDGVG